MAHDLRFETRGAVLVRGDLTLADWPERAGAADLTTIALHATGGSSGTIEDLARFLRTDVGEEFLERCRRAGLEVEYELHAAHELLPRALFDTRPELFRMDEHGARTPDANLCTASAPALEVVAENAVRIARAVRPTTGRYFLWSDDAGPWCQCAECRGLSASDQALVLTNHLQRVLAGADPRARTAHLAYANTIRPPTRVRPEPGVFLEYAPIHRSYETPYAEQTGPEVTEPIELLDANLELFPADTAQVLEYWLDVSRWSGWRRPAVSVPWHPAVFRADLEAYAARGIRHVTTFAVWIDADYVAMHGPPPVDDYGRGLAGLS